MNKEIIELSGSDLEYVEKEFKKIVKIVNKVSEEVTVNHDDEKQTTFLLALFISMIEALVDSYKHHAFTQEILEIYDGLLKLNRESAERAYK